MALNLGVRQILNAHFVQIEHAVIDDQWVHLFHSVFLHDVQILRNIVPRAINALHVLNEVDQARER